MKELLEQPQLIGSKVLIHGATSMISKKVEEIYTSLGAHVKNDTAFDENEYPPEIYCVISPIICNYKQSDDNLSFDYKKIETIALKMMETGKGRLILIVNGLGVETISYQYTRESSIQAGIIQWWKCLAARLAIKGLTANIISLGYNTIEQSILTKDEEHELLKWIPIKRFATPEDLACALRFFSEEENAYIIGQMLRLNGGLHLQPIKPLKKSKTPIITVSTTEDLFSLKGKHAVVIGASSGIGREVARTLAQRGACIGLISRNAKSLEDVANEIQSLGGSAYIAPADVTVEDHLRKSINKLWECMGKIDILVYATGCILPQTNVNEFLGWDEVMKTNFEGYVLACRIIIDKWIQNQIEGSIVGVSSVNYKVIPLTHMEAYGTSKAALVQFSHSLASTYGRYGVRVNCVAPGCTYTPMTEQLSSEFWNYWLTHIPMKRIGQPREVATVIAYLVSPAASYVTGQTLICDGGYTLGELPMFQK